MDKRFSSVECLTHTGVASKFASAGSENQIVYASNGSIAPELLQVSCHNAEETVELNCASFHILQCVPHTSISIIVERNCVYWQSQQAVY